MKKALIVLLLIILAFRLYVSSQGTRMDGLKKEKLAFNSLPPKVKSKFKTVISNRFSGEYNGEPGFYNLSATPVKFITVSRDNSFLGTLINGGLFYQFVIKGETLKLDGNLGKPLIIYDLCLYYPDKFNTGREEYLSVAYIKIDFSELID